MAVWVSSPITASRVPAGRDALQVASGKQLEILRRLGAWSPVVQDDRCARSERAICTTTGFFQKPCLASFRVWATFFSAVSDYTVLPRVATSPQIVRDRG